MKNFTIGPFLVVYILQAGLCSDTWYCRNLEVATARASLLRPSEKNPDKILLALEPECAVLYCRQSQQKVSALLDEKLSSSKGVYMVVDIGGGTIDISTYKTIDIAGSEHIEVIRSPTGDSYGGMKVNWSFQSYLGSLVDDQNFQRYLNTNDTKINVAHKAALDEMLYKTFEAQKKYISSRRGRISVRLPNTFLETYLDKLERYKTEKGGIQLVDQELRISREIIEAFFESATSGILECIKEALLDVGSRVDTLYLVGGFGGCKYVSSKIKACHDIQKSCSKFVVPEDAAEAVVCGAVMYGKSPQTVCARRADATYGIQTNIQFKTSLHCEEYKLLDDDGDLFCKNIFNTVVERGDTVNSDQSFKLTYFPMYHNQKAMTISVYSSLEKDVWYTTGKRGKGIHKEPVKVYHIGTLTIEMPNTTRDKDRNVNVYFDFGHTEINVKVYDRTSGNEVKAVLDFLGTSPTKL